MKNCIKNKNQNTKNSVINNQLFIMKNLSPKQEYHFFNNNNSNNNLNNNLNNNINNNNNNNKNTFKLYSSSIDYWEKRKKQNDEKMKEIENYENFRKFGEIQDRPNISKNSKKIAKNLRNNSKEYSKNNLEKVIKKMKRKKKLLYQQLIQ